MKEHRDETHVCHLTVMAHQRAPHGSHVVATEEPELRLCVGLRQFAHQVCGMQVAARLSHYQVISHL